MKGNTLYTMELCYICAIYAPFIKLELFNALNNIHLSRKFITTGSAGPPDPLDPICPMGPQVGWPNGPQQELILAYFTPTVTYVTYTKIMSIDYKLTLGGALTHAQHLCISSNLVVMNFDL